MINTFPNLQFVDRFVVCTQLTQKIQGQRKKLNINDMYPLTPLILHFLKKHIACQKVQPKSDKGY